MAGQEYPVVSFEQPLEKCPRSVEYQVFGSLNIALDEIWFRDTLRNEGVEIKEVLGMVCGKCNHSFTEAPTRFD